MMPSRAIQIYVESALPTPAWNRSTFGPDEFVEISEEASKRSTMLQNKAERLLQNRALRATLDLL